MGIEKIKSKKGIERKVEFPHLFNPTLITDCNNRLIVIR